jgi:uncharacterized Zn-finger protein
MVEAPIPAGPEVIEVTETEVACDGGDSDMGHPRVFLAIGASGQVVCPYCDRLFKLKAGSKPALGH